MMGQTLGLIAAILSIYQFFAAGKTISLRLRSQDKIEKFGRLEVY